MNKIFIAMLSSVFFASGALFVSAQSLPVLVAPTLGSVSPSSTYVVGGTNKPMATFVLKTATAGTYVNVRELRFRTTGLDAIDSITVGGVTVPVISGATTTVSGLNISVGSTGTDVPVTVHFSGFQNSTGGGILTSAISNVTLTLGYVEGIVVGGGNVVVSTTPVSSNAMTLVASVPFFDVVPLATSYFQFAPEANGMEALIFHSSISANEQGKIGVSSLTLSVASVGIQNFSLSSLRVADQQGTVVGATAVMNSPTSITITFPSTYEVPAGQVKYIDVYGSVNGSILSSQINPFIAVTVPSSSSFVWRDVVSNSIQSGGNLPGTPFPSESYRVVYTTGSTIPPTPPSNSSCVALTVDMRVGSTDQTTGGQVTKLQNFLIAGGYLTVRSGTALGTFGLQTASAVVKFQRANGITQNGLVGPVTRAKILSLSCSGLSTAVFATITDVNIGGDPKKLTFKGKTNGSTLGFAIVNSDETLVYTTENHADKMITVSGGEYSQTVLISDFIPGTPTNRQYILRVYAETASGPTNVLAAKTFTMPSGVPIPTIPSTITPVISYVTPTTVQAGKTAIIYGNNFDSTSVVIFDGTYGITINPDAGYPVNVATAAGTEALAFKVPAGTSAGAHTVAVAQKASSLPSSNAVTLTVSVSTDVIPPCPTGQVQSDRGCVVPVTSSLRSFVTTSEVTCNSLVFQAYGAQVSKCSIGGGCSTTGSIPTTSNPSANPTLWGACIATDAPVPLKVGLSQTSSITGPGQQFLVTLESVGVTSCKVTYTGPNGGGTLSDGPTSGSLAFTPTVLGTYIATAACTGPNGSIGSNPLSHVVTSPSITLPTCSITTDKSSYTYGETVRAKYTSQNAAYATWMPDSSGKENFVLPGDKLTPFGEVTLIANVVGSPSLTLKAENASGSGTCTKVVPVTTATVSTAPAPTVARTQDSETRYGGTATIRWAVAPTTGVICVAAGGGLAAGTTIGTSGSWVTPALYTTTQYGMKCTTDSSGLSTYKYITVTVPPQTGDSTSSSAPVITLTPDMAVAYGKTATLTWSVTPMTGVTCISYGGNLAPGTTIGTTGSWVTPALYTTTQYGIKCTNTSNGLTSYKYVTASVSSQTPPTASLTQSNSSTKSGDSFTLTLTSSNTNQEGCRVTYTGPDGGGTISSGPTSGSLPFAPTVVGSYTATATCTGDGGSVKSSVTHTVTAKTTTTTSTTNQTSTTNTTSTTDSCATLNASKYYTDQCCTTNTGTTRCGTQDRASDSCAALNASEYYTNQCCTTSVGTTRCGTKPLSTNVMGPIYTMGESGAVLGMATQCTDIPYNLHRGYESAVVSSLQSFLVTKGFLSAEVTGFYGDKTVEAVKSYQSSKGLSVTGMVYEFTRASVKAETCQ